MSVQLLSTVKMCYQVEDLHLNRAIFLLDTSQLTLITLPECTMYDSHISHAACNVRATYSSTPETQHFHSVVEGVETYCTHTA